MSVRARYAWNEGNIQHGPAPINNSGMMNRWTLRFIGAVAYGFLAVGLLCNVIFYSSQTDSTNTT